MKALGFLLWERQPNTVYQIKSTFPVSLSGCIKNLKIIFHFHRRTGKKEYELDLAVVFDLSESKRW